MRLIIALVYLLIAYGSLFPFNFSLAELSLQYSKLLRIELTSLGDILANIALFIPLGFLYGLIAKQLEKHDINYVLLLKVTAFALLLQLIQIALPTRDQNITDVLFNLCGFIGAYYGVLLLRITFKISMMKLQHLPIAIALTYLLSELVPFVPSIDFQGFKDSIKPLMVLPSVDILGSVLFTSIIWLLVIRLLSFQSMIVPIKTTLLLWLAMLLSKVIVYSNHLSYIDLISPLLAIFIASNIRLTDERITKLLIMVVLLVFTVSSVASLGQTDIIIEMFIPFHAYLTGQLAVAVQGMLFKLFLFSAMIWLAFELAWPVKKVAFFLAFFITVLETAQLFMPSRTSDYSDVLLVIFAYLLVRKLGDYFVSQQTELMPNAEGKAQDYTAQKQAYNVSPWRKVALAFVTVYLVFYFSVNFFLTIPGVPYNLVELFQHQASLVDLFFFLVFLLLLAGGSAAIAQQCIKESKDFSKKLVVLHLATLTLSFIFLALAVTPESIEDIVGAAKLPQIIYKNQTSDHLVMVLAKVVSLSYTVNVARYVEFLFRFVFLYALVQVPLTFWFIISHNGVAAANKVKAALISINFIILSYLVVFTFAVTDNLTELVASPVLLIVALFMLTASLVLAMRFIQRNKPLWAVILTVVIALVSWPMSQYVFEQVIIKYGYVFSAFDFLIGGGREHKITEQALILRWLTLMVVFQWLLILVSLKVKILPPISLSKSSFKKMVKYTSLAGVLLVLFFLGNRLFGEHLHWQTLVQHFSDDAKHGYHIDKSTPMLPKVIKPGIIYLNDQRVADLTSAFKLAKQGDVIRLTAGHYQQAAVLYANDVSIIGELGAVIFGKSIQGKGALVIKGDNTYIEGIECHSIYVPDNNGVCVRLEGKGITLNKVHFHHAQGGLLGSRKGGDIRIENSRFEHLGDGAFYHGIYTLEQTRLFIHNSYLLNNRNAGHEIKSRSYHTEITHSVVAASQSKDSRLIDVPNGGILIIRDNILVEGPFSENHDLLSWGVEGVKHPQGQIIIENNIFIADKKSARLIAIKNAPSDIRINNNIVIGDISGLSKDENVFFKSRSEVSLPLAPEIPLLENQVK